MRAALRWPRLAGHVALAAALGAALGCSASHEPAATAHGDGSVRCDPSSGEIGPVVTASVRACGDGAGGPVHCWTVTVAPDGRATDVTGDMTGVSTTLARCVRDSVVGACFPDDAASLYSVCPFST